MPVFTARRLAATLKAAPFCTALMFGGAAAAAGPDDCSPPAPPTFTVHLPKLTTPPDSEGQGWSRPPVWAGHPGAADDSIEVPNGRPIYALLVGGYAQNGNLDQLIFYDFARHLMARGAYVHFAWWNNLLAPYMERPLHYGQSHPGTNIDLASFRTAQEAADKAVPGEDYQFVADAKRLLSAIRANNPSAMIIVAGHSMGGSAIVHLASEADVVIDIAAPIDPVNNRNYPWAGPILHSGQHYYNWTRWRATRGNFLGFRRREPLSFCDPNPAWLADISDATSACPAGPVVHEAPRLTFGGNIINLYHRWQNEARFPFDFQDNYTFGHARPPGGTTTQSAVNTTAAGSDPGGWPSPNFGGTCCPIGLGLAWPGDGHGEIIGSRGPVPPEPLATRVRTSPMCVGCPDTTWPARTRSGGTWTNGNGAARRALLVNLESLPLSSTWAHEPYNTGLCLVSPGLIGRFNTMNKPPVADAGPDLAVDCDGCPAAVVTLDGSASTDPDDDALTYAWAWGFGSATGRTVEVDLPPGAHCITLEVADPSGHIARDTLAVTVTDTTSPVAAFTSNAAGWAAAAGDYEARAFDEFYPGLPNASGCLLPQPSEPATLPLAGGTLTVTARQNGQPACAITDSATAPAVADAFIPGAASVVEFAFDPPVTALYTYYGSLHTGETATMALFDAEGDPVAAITTPPSTHASLAAGQGFTSTTPIARIEFSSTEAGAVAVGAFVGLRAGEPSLGVVDLGGYSGPDGSGVIQLDFACAFVPGCAADFNGDGTLDSQDFFGFLAAFLSSDAAADFTGDGTVDAQDFFAFLDEFFAGCG